MGRITVFYLNLKRDEINIRRISMSKFVLEHFLKIDADSIRTIKCRVGTSESKIFAFVCEADNVTDKFNFDVSAVGTDSKPAVKGNFLVANYGDDGELTSLTEDDIQLLEKNSIKLPYNLRGDWRYKMCNVVRVED